LSAERLNYERQGSGPPLLLVHGLGGSLVVWRPVIPLLSDERDVIAVDLPGFGASAAAENGADPYTPAAMAASLEQFCAKLGIGRPHVAGNSLGAWVALEMAKRGAAASVAAISPAGLWRRQLGPRSYDAHASGNRLRPVIGGLLRTRRGRRLLLRSTIGYPDRVPREDAAALVSSYLDSPGYGPANEAMRGQPFVHEGKVDVPVTVAWGRLDRLVGRPSRTRMPPGVTLREMPGWGHTPTWDDPEGVAKLLLEASSGKGE
jgi:pimeloyl-ACP methyl ester carboxylesterase